MNATQGELLERNLYQVMNERDPDKRRAAVERIYAAEATFFEVDEAATGHDAVQAMVEGILEKIPPHFVFRATTPVTENHGVGRLSWGVGPVGGPDAVTGTDIALFKDRRIQSLYVFLDERVPALNPTS